MQQNGLIQTVGIVWCCLFLFFVLLEWIHQLTLKFFEKYTEYSKFKKFISAGFMVLVMPVLVPVWMPLTWFGAIFAYLRARRLHKKLKFKEAILNYANSMDLFLFVSAARNHIRSIWKEHGPSEVFDIVREIVERERDDYAKCEQFAERIRNAVKEI